MKLLAITSTTLLLAGASHAQEIANVLGGLPAPLHIDSHEDGLLIATAGTGNNDGAIQFYDPQSSGLTPWVTGLPSVIGEAGPFGVNAALRLGDDLYVAQGNVDPSGSAPDSSCLFHFDLDGLGWSPGDAPLTPADGSIIQIRDFLMVDNGYVDSNVYDLTYKNGGELLYIVDAGANAVVSYRPSTGSMNIVADFPMVPNDTGVGPPMSQAVPTAIEKSGNKFLVTTLTGFPFNPGAATVYELSPAGNLTVKHDGLSLMTDILVDEDENCFYVSQFAAFDLASGFLPGTGSILKIKDGIEYPMATGLTFPSSVAMLDGSIHTGSLALGTLDMLAPGFMSYCETHANSEFSGGATMAHAGSASISANDLILICNGVPAGETGLFFYGRQPAAMPFGNGTLCVGGNLFRLGVVQSDANGDSTFAVDNTALLTQGAFAPGDLIQVQHWYRDLPSFQTSGLSNGLQILLAP